MKPNGYVLYEGPSLLTGKPIVAIAVGLNQNSRNAKTGGMTQTYILCQDENPIAAVNSGADASICGGCLHRKNPLTGVRTCYVRIDSAPNGVYKAWKRGVYPVLTDWAVFTGKAIRFGTYGDPAAVPLHVWQNLAAYAGTTTGYTHQWRAKKFAGLASFCQASAETADDVIRANAKGFGTFRVLPVMESVPSDSFHCPASAERGKVATCLTCGVCDGFKGINVTILAHGSSGHKYSGQR